MGSFKRGVTVITNNAPENETHKTKNGFVQRDSELQFRPIRSAQSSAFIKRFFRILNKE